jgi:hypothetical protein
MSPLPAAKYTASGDFGNGAARGASSGRVRGTIARAVARRDGRPRPCPVTP